MDRTKGESWLSRTVIKPVTNLQCVSFLFGCFSVSYISFRSQIHDGKLEEKVFGETETVSCDYFKICGCGLNIAITGQR